ncbi:TolC family protein [candidate division KSB1 bacterium]|nr:TolC family protein [candidate division KSB1 bacterium]
MLVRNAKRYVLAGISLLAFLGASNVLAQQIHTLTLDQSLEIALGRSYDARRLEQSLINSRMSLRAVRLGFKSNAQFDLVRAPYVFRGEQSTIDPLRGITVFTRTETFNLTGRLSVNQPISFTDGTLSLVGTMDRLDQTGTIDRLEYSPDLRIQYSQPLFTLNRLKTGLRRAELNLESTVQAYTRSALELEFSVTSNFYQLYRSQRQVEIDREQVEQSENAFRIATLKQQAGLLPEVEVLRLEVDLANAQNTAESSQASLEQAEDQFKNLIGLSINDSVRVITALEYAPVEVTLEKAMREALDRRTELREDEINIELSQINIKEVDTNKEIRGQLSLSLGIFNRDETLDAAFRDFDNNRGINVSMSVPLWDWGKNSAEVQAARANLESNRLTQQNRVNVITQEIRAAVRNLHSAQKRVDITKRSEELAQKSYRISLLRFENGDISSQDLALEQNRYTQARINYLIAIIDYKQSLADLRRKTLWDFERETPVEIAVPE